jgi:hypothetical protein
MLSLQLVVVVVAVLFLPSNGSQRYTEINSLDVAARNNCYLETCSVRPAEQELHISEHGHLLTCKVAC